MRGGRPGRRKRRPRRGRRGGKWWGRGGCGGGGGSRASTSANRPLLQPPHSTELRERTRGFRLVDRKIRVSRESDLKEREEATER